MKRRVGVAPGKPWVPFDQFDYTLGAFALTAWLFWPGWPVFCALLVVNGVLSLGAHLGGHAIGLLRERV